MYVITRKPTFVMLVLEYQQSPLHEQLKEQKPTKLQRQEPHFRLKLPPNSWNSPEALSKIWRKTPKMAAVAVILVSCQSFLFLFTLLVDKTQPYCSSGLLLAPSCKVLINTETCCGLVGFFTVWEKHWQVKYYELFLTLFGL